MQYNGKSRKLKKVGNIKKYIENLKTSRGKKEIKKIGN